MAIVAKVLGQVAPIAATDTTLYTVPGTTETTFNVYACNRSSTPTDIRVTIKPNGDATADKHHIAFDLPIGANETLTFDGLTADAADVVEVFNTLATVSFSAFGLETGV